ncbi:SpaA isopeptide-forming pilin-related protein [Enterococcus hulanensis]|uniref:MSCRAMM family protein n=1 Tax=Enterococcus hulanensis TaxID=2559929 RepID=UPI00288FEFE4|nr:SpaA isopeptide-forming pilin-related protein [Enterococcus hulanensis]MDT2661153.1 SpaA isopeptide-forming pilin-related protein [Enterococcus hulanensis]
MINKRNKKRFILFSMILIALGTVISIFTGGLLKVNSAEVKMEPKVQSIDNATVYYNTANLYTMRGIRNGVAWSDVTASLAVQYPDGRSEMVFCKQPGVPLSGGMWTEGYTGVESDNVSRRSQIASCIWQYVFPNRTQHEEMAARAVFWNNLSEYNLDITSIDQIPEYPQLRAKLDKAIDEYDNVPSFHNTTVKLKLNETKTLQSGGVNLNLFDTVVEKSPGLDYVVAGNGQSVNVKATDPTVKDAIVRVKRSYMEGTPILWTKPGSQTVVTPRIKDPNRYSVYFDVELTGDIDILKLDRDSDKALAGFKFEVTFPNNPALPKQTVTTGSDGKAKVKNVPNGVKVVAKEIFAPAPYILSSALNESDEVSGTAQAGKTVTLTKKNKKATGQIIIQKIGKDNGGNLLNGNYSFEGNKFEIRENNKDGKLVDTITTNIKGEAKSKNDLIVGGTYHISETTAGKGFVKSFEGKTIKIEYAGQTVPIVICDVDAANQEVYGQIVIKKTGLESGSNLWNGHYSLAGNVFEVRENDANGKIVGTMTTNAAGEATFGNKLPLGKYYISEKVAGPGFVNSFKPVTVDIKYKDQATPIVIVYGKGTNQEITGESMLTKVDKDTNEETQGSATFEGAEYTLYYGEDIGNHKNGDPVKWTDTFKPVLVKGTKSKLPVEKDAITLMIDKDRQVAVKHLAVGKYFWRESKAPIGYTEDQTKYTFEIKKKDDLNAIITENVTAKEQVIRFGFDFFKFANSSNGSASTGFNDLEFKLTPLEGTKEITGAEDTVKTKYHEGLGFDGYGKFSNIPIGDYLFEEIEAPKGFKKIQPIEIHSRFEENEEDYKKSQYIFTLTEVDQKEPIKTVKVPYSKLTNQAFSVSLNRLMLYDLPEERNQLTSLATWINEEKVLKDSSKGTINDLVSYKLNQTKDDWYLVSQVVDVAATKEALEKDKDAEPVILEEITTTQENQKKTGYWEIKQEIDPMKVNDKTLVLFNTLYENEKAYEDGEEPIAIDNNLENQAQTLKVKIENHIKIKTKAHLEDEGQTFTHGDVLAMYDDVEITHSEIDGKKEAFETILVALLPDGKTEEIWKSGLIDYVVEDETFTKTIVTEKVDTGKYPEGTSFTFKEINYDEDQEISATHNEELDEKSQTLYPVEKPEVPATPKKSEESSEPKKSQALQKNQFPLQNLHPK